MGCVCSTIHPTGWHSWCTLFLPDLQVVIEDIHSWRQYVFSSLMKVSCESSPHIWFFPNLACIVQHSWGWLIPGRQNGGHLSYIWGVGSDPNSRTQITECEYNSCSYALVSCNTTTSNGRWEWGTRNSAMRCTGVKVKRLRMWTSFWNPLNTAGDTLVGLNESIAKPEVLITCWLVMNEWNVKWNMECGME